ncbi:MAG: GEVED domain-containing protein [Thiolinea sp.]
MTLGGISLQGQSLTINSAVTLNVAVTGSASLHGWMDWNQNGVFGDVANEVIVTEAVAASGARSLSVTPPAGSPTGTTYARFRYSNDPLAAYPLGVARDGEVEDYAVIISNSSTTLTPVVPVTGVCSLPSADRFVSIDWPATTSGFVPGTAYPFTTDVAGYTNSAAYTLTSGTLRPNKPRPFSSTRVHQRRRSGTESGAGLYGVCVQSAGGNRWSDAVHVQHPAEHCRRYFPVGSGLCRKH